MYVQVRPTIVFYATAGGAYALQLSCAVVILYKGLRHISYPARNTQEFPALFSPDWHTHT